MLRRHTLNSLKGLKNMAKIQDFEPEKLIVGIIYHEKKILNSALDILTKEFGEFDAVSDEFSFSKEFSSYYDEEIGGEGLRRIYSFKNLVDPAKQAEIKEFTNSIEAKFSENGNRKINLDPGFINHGRLMLATTKPQGFRIPLSNGIYTELTLFYARGAWHKLPWSYRDYQSELVQDFITGVRKTYLAQRKERKKSQKI